MITSKSPNLRLRSIAALAAMTVTTLFGATSTAANADCRPETLFHIIGGNASKAGLTTDLEALKDAGFGGILFFHGQYGASSAWDGVEEQMPCLSGQDARSLRDLLVRATMIDTLCDKVAKRLAKAVTAKDPNYYDILFSHAKGR